MNIKNINGCIHIGGIIDAIIQFHKDNVIPDIKNARPMREIRILLQTGTKETAVENLRKLAEQIDKDGLKDNLICGSSDTGCYCAIVRHLQFGKGLQ